MSERRVRGRLRVRCRAFAAAAAVLAGTAGCTTEQALWGAGATTVFGAASPGNEIEQTYYLGVFDPLEQVPPSLYRIRVHGQASALSRTRFASGWVPAPLADALDTRFEFDGESGRLTTERASQSQAILDRKRLDAATTAAAEAKGNRDGAIEAQAKALSALVDKLTESKFTETLRTATGEAAAAQFLAKAAEQASESAPERRAAAKAAGARAAEASSRLATIRGSARAARESIAPTAPDAGASVREFVTSEIQAIRDAAAQAPVVPAPPPTPTPTPTPAPTTPDPTPTTAPAPARATLAASDVQVFRRIATLERIAARDTATPPVLTDDLATAIQALRAAHEGKVRAAHPPASEPATGAATGTAAAHAVEIDFPKAESDDTAALERLTSSLVSRTDALAASIGPIASQTALLASARDQAAAAEAKDAAKVTELAARAEASKGIADEWKAPVADFLVGRRMVLFGPEGFREAPRNHRLVIVMGSSPQKYFEALGGMLRTVQKIELAEAEASVGAEVEAFARVLEEEARLAAAHRTTVTP